MVRISQKQACEVFTVTAFDKKINIVSANPEKKHEMKLIEDLKVFK